MFFYFSQINFKADGLYPHEGSVLTAGSDQTSQELMGLLPFTTYKITIRAFTIVGDGPSREVNARTNEDSTLFYAYHFSFILKYTGMFFLLFFKYPVRLAKLFSRS